MNFTELDGTTRDSARALVESRDRSLMLPS